MNTTANLSSSVNVSVNTTLPNLQNNITNGKNLSVSHNETNHAASNSSTEKDDFVQNYTTTVILNLDKISIFSYLIK